MNWHFFGLSKIFGKNVADKMLLFVLAWCEMETREFEQWSLFCGERWWHRANGFNQTNKKQNCVKHYFQSIE